VPQHPKVETVLRKQRIGEKVFQGPDGGKLKGDVLLEMPEDWPSETRRA